MSQQKFDPHVFMNDDELGLLLRRHDAIASPTQAELSRLESAIMARIGQRPVESTIPDSWILAGFFQQGWLARAGFFVALLIVLTGFMTGQLAYRPDTVPVFASTPSLLAFADDTAWPVLPSTDISWGDSDDE